MSPAPRSAGLDSRAESHPFVCRRTAPLDALPELRVRQRRRVARPAHAIRGAGTRLRRCGWPQKPSSTPLAAGLRTLAASSSRWSPRRSLTLSTPFATAAHPRRRWSHPPDASAVGDAPANDAGPSRLRAVAPDCPFADLAPSVPAGRSRFHTLRGRATLTTITPIPSSPLRRSSDETCLLTTTPVHKELTLDRSAMLDDDPIKYRASADRPDSLSMRRTNSTFLRETIAPELPTFGAQR